MEGKKSKSPRKRPPAPRRQSSESSSSGSSSTWRTTTEDSQTHSYSLRPRQATTDFESVYRTCSQREVLPLPGTSSSAGRHPGSISSEDANLKKKKKKPTLRYRPQTPTIGSERPSPDFGRGASNFPSTIQRSFMGEQSRQSSDLMSASSTSHRVSPSKRKNRRRYLSEPPTSDIQFSLDPTAAAGASGLHEVHGYAPILYSSDSNPPITSDVQLSTSAPLAERTSDLYVRHSALPTSPSADSNVPIASDVHSSSVTSSSHASPTDSPRPSSSGSNVHTSDTRSSIPSPIAEGASGLQGQHSDSPIPSPSADSNMPIISDIQPSPCSSYAAGPSGLQVHPSDSPIPSTSTYPLQNLPSPRRSTRLKKSWNLGTPESASRSSSDSGLTLRYDFDADLKSTSKEIQLMTVLRRVLQKQLQKRAAKMPTTPSPSDDSPSGTDSEHSRRPGDGSDQSVSGSRFQGPAAQTLGSPSLPVQVPPTPDVRYDEASMSEFIASRFSASSSPRILSPSTNTPPDAESDNSRNRLPRTPGRSSRSDDEGNHALPYIHVPLEPITAHSSSAPPKLQQSRFGSASTSSAGPSQIRPQYERVPEIYKNPLFEPSPPADSFKRTPPTPRDPETSDPARYSYRTPKSSSSSSDEN